MCLQQLARTGLELTFFFSFPKLRAYLEYIALIVVFLSECRSACGVQPAYISGPVLLCDTPALASLQLSLQRRTHPAIV
ncbi:hypothetical protein L228DRAFT_80713 [Xylona heveae TC161]|uniref:Uncharacterized protein n=1 Tax=Xylona heveae (strain CBS 132557 / TC161) TaxID=1328760 RepID=A0A165J2S5_XYLHT|nr:hypothetical protein L228DRAFT_80713 [Xylona heveae TC161]KZF25650.1 hypothetical protein L228DRAFT_80713 [Xylona heveae TC161]